MEKDKIFKDNINNLLDLSTWFIRTLTDGKYTPLLLIPGAMKA